MTINNDKKYLSKTQKWQGKKNRLTNISVDEVSIVTFPANNQPFLLIKSAVTEPSNFDWSDSEAVQELQASIEAMDPAQELELRGALGKLSVNLDQIMKTAWLTKCKAEDPALFRSLEDFSERYEWSGREYQLKDFYKTKTIKTLNSKGTHEFVDGKWLPLNMTSHTQTIDDLGRVVWVPRKKE